jgi:uncharacterized membrane protein (DUF4010 family)
MEAIEILKAIILSILLGGVIGLKSEHDQLSNSETRILGGFRSYALIALSGVITGLLITNGYNLLAAFTSLTIVMFIIIYYISGVKYFQVFGITDEISALFTHLIGILIITQIIPVQIVVAITVLIVFITNKKSSLRKISSVISRQELAELSMFAILSFIILPILPNQYYSLNDLGVGHGNIIFLKEIINIQIFNPFVTWAVVVFVSGIDLLSYIISKVIKNDKSIIVSSIIAGFVSSTAATIALAGKSKNSNQINNLVSGAIISNGSSYIQLSILALPISFVLFKTISIPSIIFFIYTLFVGYYLLKSNDSNVYKSTDKIVERDHMFKIEPALKFAGLITIVKLISNIALETFGGSGFVVATMLASISGMDIVVITLGELLNAEKIDLTLTLGTFIAASIINFTAKSIYSYLLGEIAFTKKFGYVIYFGFLTIFLVFLGLATFLF